MSDTLAATRKRTGQDVNWNARQYRLMFLSSEIHKRFDADQYFATVAEWGALKELFNWLAEQHALNSGKTPGAPIEWRDDGMFQGKQLKPGTYRALCEAYARGDLDNADEIRITSSNIILPE
jgi:hypothetical protein